MPMQKPKIDDKLSLLTDFGETEAICAEVLDDPAAAGGVLLKVMARGPFQEGQQCWIVDRDGSKIGATVENVFKQSTAKSRFLPCSQHDRLVLVCACSRPPLLMRPAPRQTLTDNRCNFAQRFQNKQG